MSLCKNHTTNNEWPADECPLCVRAERDQAVQDADGAVELAEALHRCQKERDRLREALINISIHTLHYQHADRELLVGLLASIAKTSTKALEAK